jgi:hypothetical protein
VQLRTASIGLLGLALTGCGLLPGGTTEPGIRTQGDGWRQLARVRTNVPYTVRLATNAAALEAEFRWHGIDAYPVDWDPASEVIAFFSDGIGSSCPEVAIGDITIDQGERLVYARFVDEGAVKAETSRACTADLVGSQTFVIALSRARLPESPWTLRLERDLIGCHPDCGSGPTEITVNLP